MSDDPSFDMQQAIIELMRRVSDLEAMIEPTKSTSNRAQEIEDERAEFESDARQSGLQLNKGHDGDYLYHYTRLKWQARLAAKGLA